MAKLFDDCIPGTVTVTFRNITGLLVGEYLDVVKQSNNSWANTPIRETAFLPNPVLNTSLTYPGDYANTFELGMAIPPYLGYDGTSYVYLGGLETTADYITRWYYTMYNGLTPNVSELGDLNNYHKYYFSFIDYDTNSIKILGSVPFFKDNNVNGIKYRLARYNASDVFQGYACAEAVVCAVPLDSNIPDNRIRTYYSINETALITNPPVANTTFKFAPSVNSMSPICLTEIDIQPYIGSLDFTDATTFINSLSTIINTNYSTFASLGFFGGNLNNNYNASIFYIDWDIRIFPCLTINNSTGVVSNSTFYGCIGQYQTDIINKNFLRSIHGGIALSSPIVLQTVPPCQEDRIILEFKDVYIDVGEGFLSYGALYAPAPIFAQPSAINDWAYTNGYATPSDYVNIPTSPLNTFYPKRMSQQSVEDYLYSIKISYPCFLIYSEEYSELVHARRKLNLLTIIANGNDITYVVTLKNLAIDVPHNLCANTYNIGRFNSSNVYQGDACLPVKPICCSPLSNIPVNTLRTYFKYVPSGVVPIPNTAVFTLGDIYATYPPCVTFFDLIPYLSDINFINPNLFLSTLASVINTNYGTYAHMVIDSADEFHIDFTVPCMVCDENGFGVNSVSVLENTLLGSFYTDYFNFRAIYPTSLGSVRCSPPVPSPLSIPTPTAEYTCTTTVQPKLVMRFKETLAKDLRSDAVDFLIDSTYVTPDGNAFDYHPAPLYNKLQYRDFTLQTNTYTTNLSTQPVFTSFGTDGLIAAERWETLFTDLKDNLPSSLIDSVVRVDRTLTITFLDTPATRNSNGMSPQIRGINANDPIYILDPTYQDSYATVGLYGLYKLSDFFENVPIVEACVEVCNDPGHSRIVMHKFKAGYTNTVTSIDLNIERSLVSSSITNYIVKDIHAIIAFTPALAPVSDTNIVAAINNGNYTFKEITTIQTYDTYGNTTGSPTVTEIILQKNLTASIIENLIHISIPDVNYIYAGAYVFMNGFIVNSFPHPNNFLMYEGIYACKPLAELVPPPNPLPVIPEQPPIPPLIFIPTPSSNISCIVSAPVINIPVMFTMIVLDVTDANYVNTGNKKLNFSFKSDCNTTQYQTDYAHINAATFKQGLRNVLSGGFYGYPENDKMYGLQTWGTGFPGTLTPSVSGGSLMYFITNRFMECTDTITLCEDLSTFPGGVNNVVAINSATRCFKAFRVSFYVDVEHVDFVSTDLCEFSLTYYADHNTNKCFYNTNNAGYICPRDGNGGSGGVGYCFDIDDQFDCRHYGDYRDNASNGATIPLDWYEVGFHTVVGLDYPVNRSRINSFLYLIEESSFDYDTYQNIDFSPNEASFTNGSSNILTSLTICPVYYSPEGVISIKMHTYNNAYACKFNLNIFPDCGVTYPFEDLTQTTAEDFLKSIVDKLINEYHMQVAVSYPLREIIIYQRNQDTGIVTAFCPDNTSFPGNDIFNIFEPIQDVGLCLYASGPTYF